MATTTLLSRTSRSGSITSPTYTVPTGSTGAVLLRTNMTENVITTPGKSGTMMVEVSDDGGSTWALFMGIAWKTGPIIRSGISTHNPGVGCNLSALAGRMIRLQITLSASISIGFVVVTP